MRGLTMPRPVRVESVILIGKEVIVDPTDTDEGLTAEMLSETKTLEYQDPAEWLEALRAAVRDRGVKRVAREARIDESQVRRFVNQQTTPHTSTIISIAAALQRLGRAADKA
jgi:DNA-binding phage protein